MQHLAERMAKEMAQLWINHNKAQRGTQKMSPQFYE
jgi:N-acyl homoserine lactone hydrolase